MDDLVKKVEKSLNFMDKMVRLVFYATFLFTLIVLAYVFFFNWENILYILVERWFTIMVGELIVMGVIQIGKQLNEVLNKKYECECEARKEEEECVEDNIDD